MRRAGVPVIRPGRQRAAKPWSHSVNAYWLRPTHWRSATLGEQIVLVAHGGVLDMLYRFATRQPIEAPRTWQLGNASINRLLWTPQGLSLIGWSDTRHLDQNWRDEAIS